MSLFFGFVIVAQPILLGIAATVTTMNARLLHPSPMYWGSLTLAILVGSVALFYRAMRRPAGVPGGRYWSAWQWTGLLVLGITIHLVTIGWLDVMVRNQIRLAQDDANALAISLTPPAVSDEVNAATLYAAATQALPEKLADIPYKNWQAWMDPSGDVDDPANQELGEYLRSHERALTLAREGAQRADYYYPHDYTQAFFEPDQQDRLEVRTLATLLALDARYQAITGNLPTCLADVNALFALSRHLGQDLLLLNLLTSGACDGKALKTLEAVLRIRPELAGQLDQLTIDRKRSFRQQMERSLQTELVAALGIFSITGTKSPGFGPYWRVFFVPGDLAACRDRVKRMQDLCTQSYSQVRQMDFLHGFKQSSNPGQITSMMVPSLSVVQRAFQSDAYHRLSLLLAAAARYHARHGVYPENVQSLAAEDPSLEIFDPFDDQPIRILKKDGGIVLYSIGLNAQDDHGVIDLDDEGSPDADDGDIAVGLGTTPDPFQPGSF